MRLALAAVLLLGACATPATRPDYPLITEDDDPAARAAGIGHGSTRPHAAGTPTAAPAPAKRARGPFARTGQITRDELDGVLDAGPGVFLHGMVVDADVVDGRLRGWRIRSFQVNEPKYDHVDLQPGDVVLAVNGRLIVRPEHLQRVWDSLREAKALVVDVERHGATFKLEYTIVDSPAPPGSNTGP